MIFTQEQQDQIDKLLCCRLKMEQSLDEIESILQIYFSKEFDSAYQHWIPQIKTALRNNTRWLPRGQFSMQDTINRLTDQIKESDKKGVSRYI